MWSVSVLCWTMCSNEKWNFFFLSSLRNVWSCETMAFHVTKIVGPLRRGYFSQFLFSFTSPLRRQKIKFYRGYRKLGDINLHLLSKVNICTSLLTFFNYIMQFLNVFNKKKFAWYQTIKFNPIGLVLCIVSQRSSSGSQKTGSSLQNLWPILYDIGAFQMATQLKQF